LKLEYDETMLNVSEGDNGSMVETTLCVNVTGALSSISLSQKRVKLTILPSTTAIGILIGLLITVHLD
jgi:hypothetical protein